jgi:hypothetical protein
MPSLIISQNKVLFRSRRDFASVGNDSTPDCASHGDDSFQEDHFSGIPTTLCINIGFFAISVFIFSILRKNAWNYGIMGTDLLNQIHIIICPNKNGEFEVIS